jgi:hypothetical protein
MNGASGSRASRIPAVGGAPQMGLMDWDKGASSINLPRRPLLVNDVGLAHFQGLAVPFSVI